MPTNEKPDAQFSDVDDWSYDDGYTAGREDTLALMSQEKTDLTLAGAILIALISGALGFIFGMVL